MLFSQGEIQSQMRPTLLSSGSQMARRRTQSVELPANVRRVSARGRDYYYFQIGRGTKAEQPRIRLPDDPRSPEFWAAYRAAKGAADPLQNENSFNKLIAAYQKSPQFSCLAASTQRNYRRYHEIIRASWGHLDVGEVEPRHVLELQDAYQEQAPTANALIRALSALLHWSVPRGYRSGNPCREVELLPTGDGWAPWPWEMIELVEKVGPAWMWQATALALYTGQRQGDVLAMRWPKVRNGLIEVKQEKTGRELIIPAHQKLLSVLAEADKSSVQILTNTRGCPWTPGGFRTSWGNALVGPLAVIREKGLVFHGLRKSAVVMLLEAGCTDAEVASITGQSRQMVVHYSRQVNQGKLAAAAILKWERSENG